MLLTGAVVELKRVLLAYRSSQSASNSRRRPPSHVQDRPSEVSKLVVLRRFHEIGRLKKTATFDVLAMDLGILVEPRQTRKVDIEIDPRRGFAFQVGEGNEQLGGCPASWRSRSISWCTARRFG